MKKVGKKSCDETNDDRSVGMTRRRRLGLVAGASPPLMLDAYGEFWSLGSIWGEMSFTDRPVDFDFVSDERDAIQKKTFTKWVNKHLNKVSQLID
jgi:hypothetical protein